MSLVVPAHAFDYLGIREKTYAATDLLTNAPVALTLQRDAALALALPARGGVVLKVIS